MDTPPRWWLTVTPAPITPLSSDLGDRKGSFRYFVGASSPVRDKIYDYVVDEDFDENGCVNNMYRVSSSAYWLPKLGGKHGPRLPLSPHRLQTGFIARHALSSTLNRHSNFMTLGLSATSSSIHTTTYRGVGNNDTEGFESYERPKPYPSFRSDIARSRRTILNILAID